MTHVPGGENAFPGTERGSIVFVGSVLPARFIVENAKALNIEKIVLQSPVFEHAYRHVAARIPGVGMSVLKGSDVGMAISVALQLVAARRKRQAVVFFHECCWPVFDMLVSLIRPAGFFLPQVTMSPFEEVDAAELPKPANWKQKAKRLIFDRFAKRFIVYRFPAASAVSGHDYYLSFREYPPSIDVWPAGQRIREADDSAVAEGDERRVIFITGTEPVPDDYLRNVYLSFIKVAQDEGFTVFIKDHPVRGLNVQDPLCVTIDPTIPVELVDQRFAVAISVASTGLLAVGDRKVSIIHALEAMPDEVKRTGVRQLRSRAGDRIEFVASPEEARLIFRDSRRPSADRLAPAPAGASH